MSAAATSTCAAGIAQHPPQPAASALWYVRDVSLSATGGSASTRASTTSAIAHVATASTSHANTSTTNRTRFTATTFVAASAIATAAHTAAAIGIDNAFSAFAPISTAASTESRIISTPTVAAITYTTFAAATTTYVGAGTCRGNSAASAIRFDSTVVAR